MDGAEAVGGALSVTTVELTVFVSTANTVVEIKIPKKLPTKILLI
jgi:hypothetical protein